MSGLSLGGAERVAAALSRSWSGEGREVTVVTIASRDGDAYGLAPEVRRVALDLYRPSPNVLYGLVRATRRVIALRRALLGARPDVVVSFLGCTNVLALLAMGGTGIPVYACERSDPRHEPIGWPWRGLRRVLYPRASGVVVQTESVAAWARAFCSRVSVIPNFVEAPRRVACPGAEGGAKRLIAMGRLVPEKGFDLLIQAFRLIAGAHPRWTLTILGEGPGRKELEALVRACGLQERVALPGRISDPESSLARGHAFALSSRYEGYPNALLEAMACGLPAVAFDCPSGPADIIVDGENGVLVEAGDVSRFADALDRLMRSPAERARLGLRAQAIAVQLAPEKILGRWSNLLEGRPSP